MPEVAQMRNPRLVKSLKASLQHHQVDVSEQEAVTGFDIQQDRVVGIHTISRTIPTEKIVVTAGAWSAALLQQAGVSVDVEPVRGQMLVFKALPELVKHTILSQGHYLIPRRDGRVLIGSTLEYVGFDKSTTEQARAELIESALALIPQLGQYAVEKHWSGLRPGSRSGVPFIGSSPSYRGSVF